VTAAARESPWRVARAWPGRSDPNPGCSASIWSVDMGRPSRIVQQRLPAEVIFQAWRPVSVVDYGHGSSFGSSHALSV